PSCHTTLLFTLLLRPPPRTTLFPYTTLFRSEDENKEESAPEAQEEATIEAPKPKGFTPRFKAANLPKKVESEAQEESAPEAKEEDRKSTRLNSSHVKISYAVFCLKKKTKDEN